MTHQLSIAAPFLVSLAATPGLAQIDAQEPAAPASEKVIPPVPDYSGDILHRRYLTGD